MSVTVLIFIGILGAGMMLFFYALPARSVALKERVEQAAAPGMAGSLDAYKISYQWDEDDEDAPIDTGSATLDNIRERIRSLEGKYPKLKGYARELVDANINLHPGEWFVLVGAVEVFLGIVLDSKFNSAVGFIAGLAVAYIGQGVLVKQRQNSRRRAFDKQLGDTLMLLANALKAGFGFDQAMQSVAHEAATPVKEEFLRYCREVSLGLAADSALVNMLERNRSMDLNIAISAVQINRQVGGNLSESLETIAETIRERVKVKQEIRTLTAQARFSGYLISVLPVALGGLLFLISPDYMGPMLSTGIGLGMLGAGGFFIVIGSLIIRKIVNVDA